MAWWNKIFNGVFGGSNPAATPKQSSSFILDPSSIGVIRSLLEGDPLAGEGGKQTKHIMSNLTKGFSRAADSDSLNLNFFDPKKAFAPRDTFFAALNKWHFNVPDQRAWAVVMTLPDILTRQGKLQADYYLKQLEEFPEMGANNAVVRSIAKELQYTTGCLFAQSVAIPGESVNYTFTPPSGDSTGGLIGFPYFATRQPFTPLSITYRETNVSFIDFVLRPWMIMASHMGLTERHPGAGMGVKADIYVIQFARAGAALESKPNPVQPEASVVSEHLENVVPLIPRKIWRFVDCVPTRVPPSDHSYSESTIEAKSIEFIYKNYEVHLPSFYLNQAEAVASQVDTAYAHPSQGGRMSSRAGEFLSKNPKEMGPPEKSLPMGESGIPPRQEGQKVDMGQPWWEKEKAEKAYREKERQRMAFEKSVANAERAEKDALDRATAWGDELADRSPGDPIHEQAYQEQQKAYRDAHSAGEKVKDLNRMQFRKSRVDHMDAQLKSMREQGHHRPPSQEFDDLGIEKPGGNTAENHEAYRKLSAQRDRERARAEELKSQTYGDEQWNAYNYVPLREMNEKVKLEKSKPENQSGYIPPEEV